MSRVLITLWDGGGNSPPVLSVASALADRGHRVRVLADRSLAAAVSRAGAEHVPWISAPQRQSADPETEFIRDYEPRTPIGTVGRIRDRLIADPAAAFFDDTRIEIDRFAPDVVLVENLLFGSQCAAEASGLPYASLVPNVYPGRVAGSPPFGLGLRPRDGLVGRLRDRSAAAVGGLLWNRRLDDLNLLRQEVGLRPVGSLFDCLELPDRVLVLTSSVFDFGAGDRAPTNVVYCGPRLADPDWSGEWVAADAGPPLVLASLSTTTQDQHRMLPRVVDALGRLPVQGLVTTGPSASYSGPGAGNVTVVRSAPHSAVLKRASATISHGGHGTAIKSLAAGVPLLCIPVSRDQPETAARVVHAGAGLRLGPNASSAKIARALSTLLSDPAYAKAASRIAEAIAADIENDRAVAEIESLAGLGVPA